MQGSRTLVERWDSLDRVAQKLEAVAATRSATTRSDRSGFVAVDLTAYPNAHWPPTNLNIEAA